MKTEQELIDYILTNGEIILYDSLGDQRLINYDKNKESLYYLRWFPRENTGEPREYLTFEKAIQIIQKEKPEFLK
ncbi:MAG: hypothetical protein KDC84_06340 [Crocinitomicaceae bacterium]|nr:hypothetical protein [Crocinitomicaceae bacterium]